MAHRATIAEAQEQPDSDAGFLVAAHEAVGPQNADAAEIPLTFGGYKVVKELGRGGMGGVYLARQLSLDRNVALKVIAPRWARDPTFLARFTREAYAAAQLVHHNIVQIYDLGAEKEVNYFSMEFVDGQTLAELIQTSGAVPPEVAASHILQAARGLKVAHDHGMIHRDIKPDNLMLSRHGIVKVADLGLVKTSVEPAAEPQLEDGDKPPAGPSERAGDDEESSPNITRVNRAMGTPAYMAPEQARDAAPCRTACRYLFTGMYTLRHGHRTTAISGQDRDGADHKACRRARRTARASGRLRAQSAVGYYSKDGRQGSQGPLCDDRRRNRRDSSPFWDSLALRHFGRKKPRLLKCRCRLSLHRRRRGWRNGPSLASYSRVARVFSWRLVAGWPGLAQNLLGIGILTPFAYAIVNGFARHTPVYSKVRQFFQEGGPSERVAAIACLGLVVLVILKLHVLLTTVFLVVSAMVLALLAHFLINRNLDQERREPLERIQGMLKSARLRGIDEETLRRFIEERCGPRWDAVQNALFGDEGHLITLGRWGQTEWARARPKLVVWRDAVLSWIEAQLRARAGDRARRYLQHLEELSLKAQGLSFLEARRKARSLPMLWSRKLESCARRACATRAAMASLSSEETRLRLFEKLREAAERPEQILGSMERGLLARRSAESLVALVGPRVRFFAGLALILGNLLWMFQNSLTDSDIPTKPLWLPLVPSLFTGVFRDLNSAVAGLILVGSALVSGWGISLVVVPAAAVALLGTTIGLPASLCLVAALILAALGFFVERPQTSSKPGVD